MAGISCCGCNNVADSQIRSSGDHNGYAGGNLAEFQNYNQTIDQLNEFDQFYRVVCYPLHCLTAKSFFDELDFQWSRYDHEVKHPRNSQRLSKILPKKADPDWLPMPYLTQLLKSSQLWPEHMSSAQSSTSSSTFIKLLQIEGLFLKYMTAPPEAPAGPCSGHAWDHSMNECYRRSKSFICDMGCQQRCEADSDNSSQVFLPQLMSQLPQNIFSNSPIDCTAAHAPIPNNSLIIN